MAHLKKEPGPRRRFGRSAAAILLLSLVNGLPACGSGVVETSGSGPDETTACAASPADHAAACPEPCAIVVDLDLDCQDPRVATLGLSVAPAPDTTWLATTTYEDRMLLSADAAGVERVGDDVLPADMVFEWVFLALSPGGEAAMLSKTGGVGWGPTEHWGGLGEAWSRSVVQEESAPRGLEIDAAGAPHAWLELKGRKPAVATLAADGTWTTEVVALSEGEEVVDHTVTTDGQDAVFVLDGFNGDWQYRTLIGGQDQPVGAAISHPWSLGLKAARGAPTAEGPAFAAAIMHPDGIHIVYPMNGSLTEVTVPDTTLIDPKCSRLAGECGASCSDKMTGVMRDSMALARTADGQLWLAHVETSIDISVHYEGGCPDPEECSCATQIDHDNGKSTLHLTRIRPDGSAPQSVLALPAARYAVEFQTFEFGADILDVRGFGTDIAIGYLSEMPRAIRLLRIDTTKLAP